MAEDFFDQTEIDVPGLVKKGAKKIGDTLGAVKDATVGEVKRTLQTANKASQMQRRGNPDIRDAAPLQTVPENAVFGAEQAADQARAAISPGLDNEIRTQDSNAAFLDDAQRKLDQKFGERQKDVFGAFDSQGNRIVSKANQRNQGAFGSGGSATGDSSGTGIGGTSSAPDPAAQLASLRETFGTPGTGNTGSRGGVALNSYARERNARLNDPRRQALAQLNSQVRRGQISARAAGGIAARLMGQQGDLQLGRERIAAQQRTEAGRQALDRSKIGSAEAIAAAKLKEGSLQSGLDRSSAEAVAQSKSATEAAKLGLGTDKFAETQRANQARENQAAQRLRQDRNLKLADLALEADRGGLASTQKKTQLAGDLVKQLDEMINPENKAATMNLLRQVAPDLFENIEE